jgi:hypothetical protein
MTRRDTGRANDRDLEFARIDEAHREEQPTAVQFAATRVDSTAAALTPAEEAHAAAVAVQGEVTANL